MTTTNLIPEVDYIINEEGNLVFTKTYLLKRGHCCMSGCTNCPYDYKNKVDPMIPAEFCDSWEDENYVIEFEEDDE